MSSASNDWIILLLIVAILGGVGYWYLERDKAVESTPAPAAKIAPEQPTADGGPRYPVPGPTVQTPKDRV